MSAASTPRQSAGVAGVGEQASQGGSGSWRKGTLDRFLGPPARSLLHQAAGEGAEQTANEAVQVVGRTPASMSEQRTSQGRAGVGEGCAHARVFLVPPPPSSPQIPSDGRGSPGAPCPCPNAEPDRTAGPMAMALLGTVSVHHAGQEVPAPGRQQQA